MDSDGDGFTDVQEIAWGTDPHDPNSHPDLVTGMAAWWPLDEGSGSQAGDVSGQNHTALLQGSPPPAWSSDTSGTALSFQGPTAHVTAADTGDLAVTTAFTLITWAKLTVGTEGTAITKSNYEAQVSSYALSVHQNRIAAQLRLGSNTRSLYGHSIIADSKWHHLAFVYNGFEFCLYVDGALDVRTHIGGSIADGNGALQMGDFNGSLRDVALYHRAFRSSEVKLLYQMVSSGATQLTLRAPVTPTFLYARSKQHGPLQTVRIDAGKGVAP